MRLLEKEMLVRGKNERFFNKSLFKSCFLILFKVG